MTLPSILEGTSIATTTNSIEVDALPSAINDDDLEKILTNCTSFLSVSVSRLAFDLGASMTSSSHGPLGLALICSDDVKDAVATYSEYIVLVSPVYDINYYVEHDWLAMEARPKYVISESVHHFLLSFGAASLLFDENVFDSALLNISDSAIYECSAEGPPKDHSVEIFKPFFKFKFGARRSRVLIPLSIANSKLPMANNMTKKSVLSLCEIERKNKSTDFITIVTNTLYENNQLLPLDKLAANFNLSTRSFQRKLQAYNTTYSKLLNSVRMEKAKKLLISRDKSIRKIALELGFTDPTSFSSAFKKHLGVSPRQYRLSFENRKQTLLISSF